MSKPVYKSITEEIRNSMNIIREDPGLNFSPATYNNLIDNNQLTNETLADGLYRELYDFRNSVIYFTKHCIDETNPSFDLKKYCLTSSQSSTLRKLFYQLSLKSTDFINYIKQNYNDQNRNINLTQQSLDIKNDFNNFLLMHTYLNDLYNKLKKLTNVDVDLMEHLTVIINFVISINQEINKIK